MTDRTRVEVNGSPVEVSAGTTLAELIEQRTGSTRGSAVVVDGVIVPRSSWPTHQVATGQQIELITAVQGG